jgi:hypothetical protein
MSLPSNSLSITSSRGNGRPYREGRIRISTSRTGRALHYANRTLLQWPVIYRKPPSVLTIMTPQRRDGSGPSDESCAGLLAIGNL